MFAGVLKFSDISDFSDLSDPSEESERSESCGSQEPARRRQLPLSICVILVGAAMSEMADLSEVMRGRQQ